MQRRRLTYHWVVFAAAFVVLLGAAGTRSTPGVLIDPLREEFGWSRATVGLAVSINVLLFGFIGPFAASLQLRYGLRRVTSIALVIIASGAALTTQMTRPWHLYLLWGLVVGTGAGCMATVFASTVASRWFVARRGVVTGVLTAATAGRTLTGNYVIATGETSGDLDVIAYADAGTTFDTVGNPLNVVALPIGSNSLGGSKALVVDGMRAYVGSENFTYQSLNQNRELGLIVTDAASVQTIASTIAADYASGRAL